MIDSNIYERRPAKAGKVRTLQSALLAKAKAEPDYRFYSLWDKVWREDVLREAFARCRRKGGSSGVDGVSFQEIEAQGVDGWLGNLREELRSGHYRPQALLRVWIPKSGGGERPLGIPTVRDRVVQTAVVLVVAPIFEADLCDEQMGFRPGRDAKTAIRRVYYQVARQGRQEVVDADLSDYFGTIPHGALLTCVARRISDGKMLALLRVWLKAPVEERIGRGNVRPGRGNHRTTLAKDSGRGTPQGSPVSPVLANVYFRRFILSWKKFGFDRRTHSVIVNYADDYVICCRPGNGTAVLKAMTQIMEKLGLAVNERKTRLVHAEEDTFDFLGYTIGRFYGRDGRSFVGTRPSKKAVRRLIRAIHDETTNRWYASAPEARTAVINQKLRGWAGYFDQGPVLKAYQTVQHYTEWRLRRWLMRRRGKRGIGYRQYPNAYLYETLGLHKLPSSRTDRPNAKVSQFEMRAGCGKSARPVRRAGGGNGAGSGY